MTLHTDLSVFILVSIWSTSTLTLSSLPATHDFSRSIRFLTDPDISLDGDLDSMSWLVNFEFAWLDDLDASSGFVDFNEIWLVDWDAASLLADVSVICCFGESLIASSMM